MNKIPFTSQQQLAIDATNTNLLISASAGTGKTTVMVERIFSLVKNKTVDIESLMVVTFTNLAAAEMKKRLVEKMDAQKDDSYIAGQLLKVEGASISTIHSLCNEIVRNYFYVVDIDPSFAILDELTVSNLQNTCMKEVLREYYHLDDTQFEKLYTIFSRNRSEDWFKKQLLRLYDFSRSQVDFVEWYTNTKNNFQQLDKSDNPICKVIADDIAQHFSHLKNQFENLLPECKQYSLQYITNACLDNMTALSFNSRQNLQSVLENLKNTKLASLAQKMAEEKIQQSDKNSKDNCVQNLQNSTQQHLSQTTQIDQEMREQEIVLYYKDLCADFKDLQDKYAYFCQTEFSELAQNTADIVCLTDKLVEILCRFDSKFQKAKRQKGGLDFSDLEHLTLKILEDSQALAELKQKYKLVFVDEYQDVNSVQESLIASFSQNFNCFAVGDVKQSIYGFRGCDPDIFVEKRKHFETNPTGNKTIELNDNFRSDKNILNFVNLIFGEIMTAEFGSVDYKNTACLQGNLSANCKLPNVQIDVVKNIEKEKKQIDCYYDLTKQSDDTDNTAVMEGKIVAQRIMQIVGSTVTLSDGTQKTIGYGDIAILSQSLTNRAQTIFNVLSQHNIPVSANFKSFGLQNKELRDIVNFFRVLDNCFNDLPLVSLCLSHFGKLSEDEVATVVTSTDNSNKSFWQRICQYVGQRKDGITDKLSQMMGLLDSMRFYSFSASVDKVVVQLMRDTQYNLFVQGLQNGQTRIRRLYNFVDSLQGKDYAQSVDKFVEYIDQMSEQKNNEAVTATNSVRMMTMHASKGLEFPVVFVVGTTTRPQSDNGTLAFNKNLGVALKHYNFENMRVCENLAFSAVSLLNAQREKEEEMRLLYVALTRAKYQLFVVAGKSDYLQNCPMRLAKKASCHAEWIFSAMKKHFGQQFVDGFCEGGICVTQWDFSSQKTTPQQANTQQLLCQQNQGLQQALDRLNYKYAFLQASKLPSKVVSSALDREFLDMQNDQPYAVDLEEIDTPINLDKQKLGIAYHKVFENLHFEKIYSHSLKDIFSDSQTTATEAEADSNLDVQQNSSTQKTTNQQAQAQDSQTTATEAEADSNVDVQQNSSTQKTTQQKQASPTTQSQDTVFKHIEQVLATLVEIGSIEQQIAQQIDTNLIARCVCNQQFAQLFDGGKVFHEIPFMLNVEYSQIADSDQSEKVILQGVIDLLILKENSAIVVDFKYMSNSRFAHKNYTRQLASYKLAVEKITDVKDVQAYIFSLADNKLIEC